MTGHRDRLLTLAVAGLLTASSCVLPDQLTQIQNDVADLKRQIGELERAQREAQRAVDELQSGAADDRDNQRDLNQILSNALNREVTLSATQRRAVNAEEYWPDMEGLDHRGTVTDFTLPIDPETDLLRRGRSGPRRDETRSAWPPRFLPMS